MTTAPSISAGGPTRSGGAPSVLEANLRALAGTNPELARRLAEAAAAPGLAFLPTDEPGVVSAVLGEGAAARQLASRRRPTAEARALIQGVDVTAAAVFVVGGFGLGHHVRALAERLGEHGLIVVFEPDVGLLRGVLERVDCADVLSSPGVRVLTDEQDAAAMMSALRGAEGLVGMGVRLVDHPPSLPRLGRAWGEFTARLLTCVDAVRMTVVTSLVQTLVTFRNFLHNADRYATTPGVGDLAGVCAGRPAVVVSAGPSLARNVRLLDDPRVRERCLIVAAQTVLKPLLARGIRPHIVTALDWSEVSTRFYEGLTPEMVRGVTLVAEAKVNPGVLSAWPGALRVLPDRVLDGLIGEGFKPDRAVLPMGATVAHLAYSVARHMGCDPVGLVGQDLGFTDGQYYAAGAAIHQTWAGELSDFNTLEMLEHQRVLRMGRFLRKATDVLGRPVYTDEQMLTYLRGFEELFAADARRGLRTVDATEGGVRKAHTSVDTLESFLALHCGDAAATVPSDFAPRQTGGAPGPVLKRLQDRLGEVRRQATRLGELSTRTADLLGELIEHQEDLPRADRIIKRLDALAEEAVAIQPGFQVVQQLGQAMVFNRLRADRLIGVDDALTPMQRQRRQAQRDLENVRSTGAVARRLGELLGGALEMLRTGVRQSADISTQAALRDAGPAAGVLPAARPRARVACVIPVDLEWSGLGRPRRLDAPAPGTPSLLARTLERVRSVPGVDAVVLVTHDEARCRGLLAPGDDAAVLVVPERELRSRRRGVARARAWSRACYRGAIANLTVFDELYHPGAFDGALRAAGAGAGLLVGPDWCALDVGLCGAVIERFHDEPDRNRLTFTPAVPGLAGCVIAAGLAGELARPGALGNAAASVGGLMAYRPEAPSVDILGQRMCVSVDPGLRDAGVRLIAETPEAVRAIIGADSPRAALAALTRERPALPEQIVLDLRTPGAGAALDAWPARCARLAGACAGSGAAVTLRLGGAGAARAAELVAPWQETGAFVHVRVAEADLGARTDWLDLGLDVLSVDARAHTGPGSPAIEALLESRRGRAGASPEGDFGCTWVVPRLVRCDAAYGAVEPFVAWAMRGAGCWALDPAETVGPGERIAPLPVPPSAARRMARTRLVITADARAAIDPMGGSGGPSVLMDGPLTDVWRVVLDGRRVDDEP
jgi:hypothetical protein